MNSKQAKALDLPDIMSRLGYEPVKSQKGGKELWYKSPFRNEQDASFHTSFLGGKWIWNDFADDGGTVIDFILRLKGYNSVKDALTFLDDMYQGSLFEKRPYYHKPKRQVQNLPDLFSFQQQGGAAAEKFFENTDRVLQFISAGPIKHPIIVNYLEEQRKIPLRLAGKYLEEVKYRNLDNGREYFAIGMKNNSDGYEIRVASSQYDFKSALIAKDITTLEGTDKGRGVVNVFEGMVDFLSLLVLIRFERLAGDAIILHSLTGYERALEHIRKNGYETVHTFLDNNPAGDKYTDLFKEAFPDKCQSKSQIFAPYTDLNEALVQGGDIHMKQPPPSPSHL